MHIINAEKGILGAVPIVAGTITLAVGSALASKIRGEKDLIVKRFQKMGVLGENE